MIRFFSTLRARLMLLAFLALLPVCALIVQLGEHYYRFVVSSVYQDAASLARLMASEQERRIEDAERFLSTLASMPSIKARSGDYCSALTEVMKQQASGYVNVGLTDANGRLMCDGLSTLRLTGFADSDWFRKSLESHEFSVGAYQVDPGSGRTVAIVVLPMLDQAGQLQGSLYAALDLAWIEQLNALEVLPKRSVLLMFDRDGMVLQRYPHPEQWVGSRHRDAPFLNDIMSAGSMEVLEMPALDGIKRLVAFKTLPSQNGKVYLAVGIPSEIAFAGLHEELQSIGIGIALAFIATLAIIWVAGERLIAGRIRHLATAVRRFGEGDQGLGSELTYPPDEIGDLARTFDRMADSIKRREKQLQRYYFALDQHAIVSTTDAAGNITHVNDKFCEATGYTREELMGKNHRILKTEHLSAETAKKMWGTLTQGQVWHSNVCNRSKDGSDFWVASSITPFMDDNGMPVQYIAIRTDITETIAVKDALQRDIALRKEAEDSLRLHDKAIQASPSGILLFSMAQGNPVIYVNPAFEAMTGFGGGEVAGRDVWCLMRQLMDADNLGKIRAAIREKREGRVLIQFTRKDGILRWADCSVAPAKDEDGEVTHFVAAFSDMTERMLMVEDLTRAKEVSEQANLAKSEFLSRMTHELRTPLNFILGFAQLLEAQPEQLTDTQLDGVKRIIKSGWHLRELIDEVLDLSRIESGRLDIQLEDVELRSLLAECTEIIKLMAAERHIQIIAKLEEDGVDRVRADRRRLKQVLLNLLSNAVKFNHEGGSITIEHEMGPSGRVRITISDTGSGIDMHRQGELFQPFSRLDADKAEIPGTGIGLAISRRFMQLMEGGIGVESTPGQGSAFWIELPCVENHKLLI